VFSANSKSGRSQNLPKRARTGSAYSPKSQEKPRFVCLEIGMGPIGVLKRDPVKGSSFPWRGG